MSNLLESTADASQILRYQIFLVTVYCNVITAFSQVKGLTTFPQTFAQLFHSFFTFVFAFSSPLRGDGYSPQMGVVLIVPAP